MLISIIGRPKRIGEILTSSDIRIFGGLTRDKELSGIEKISIEIDAESWPTANIITELHLLDINGITAEFYLADPFTGKQKQIKKIEFADGSSFIDNQIQEKTNESDH